MNCFPIMVPGRGWVCQTQRAGKKDLDSEYVIVWKAELKSDLRSDLLTQKVNGAADPEPWAWAQRAGVAGSRPRQWVRQTWGARLLITEGASWFLGNYRFLGRIFTRAMVTVTQ
jgi:hypothetical protein